MRNLTEEQKWKLIRELEKKELPEDTMKARWIRLNEIMTLAKELDVKRVEEDTTEIRERWAKLKNKYEKDLQNGKPLTK